MPSTAAPTSFSTTNALSIWAAFEFAFCGMAEHIRTVTPWCSLKATASSARKALRAAKNDFLSDREAQRNWESFTGIRGIRQQDMAMTETMGPIMNRSREHLGTTDALIIRTRRKMMAGAKALAEHGTPPPGVETPAAYHQRSGGIVLPRSADWWESTRELREKFEAGKAQVEVPAS